MHLASKKKYFFILDKFKEIFKRREIIYSDIKEFLSSIFWIGAVILIVIYFGGIIGFYYVITGKCATYTYFWIYTYFTLGGIGLGPGSHRHFSHRTYKVNRGLKIFLLICHTIAGQLSMIFWCVTHRTHHKFTDTEKDPTNIKRGFWFAHLFWLLTTTPECKKARESIDISDLTSDKDVMFQHKYYAPLNILFCIVLPTIIPYFVWNERLRISFFVNLFRWFLNYNQMSFANSIMHIYGVKPYDKNISATENVFGIMLTYGEGYHNYHHVFPWDYRSSEFGDMLHFNMSTWIIDIWAKFGWAYDRKVVSDQMIQRRKLRTGDENNWPSYDAVWGYGDIEMDIDDKAELHMQVDKIE